MIDDVSEEELGSMIEEVLQRLARDPEAAHLWHWNARPGCEDEPPGVARRSHLGVLLGLMGAAPLIQACGAGIASLDAGRDSGGGRNDAGTDGGGGGGDDAGRDGGTPPLDAGRDGGPGQPDAGRDGGSDAGRDAGRPIICGDDPCACADDPCACADDPCAG